MPPVLGPLDAEAYSKHITIITHYILLLLIINHLITSLVCSVFCVYYLTVYEAINVKKTK